MAFRVHYEILDGTCRPYGEIANDRIMLAGRKDGGFYLFDPVVEPEIIGVPVYSEGRLEGDRFAADFTDTYRMRYLDHIEVRQHFSGTLLDGGKRLEADVSLVVTSDWVEPGFEEIAQRVRNAYSVPCSSKIRVTGELINPQEFDMAQRQRLWSLLKRHMDLMLQQKPEESIAPLDEGLAIPGDHHPAFLWRKARAWFVLGEHQPGEAKEKRLEIFEKGKAAAEAAIAIAPGLGEAQFFRAANMGRINTTKGRLSTVLGLEDFEKECLMAIDQNPANSMLGFKVIGDVHFALGQFYRLVPDSWLVEVLLGTRGDLKKSIEHNRKAVEIQPSRGDYLKELGVALMCQGTEEDDGKALEEGKEWLTKAAAAAVWAHERKVDEEHVARLLNNPEEACDYSRDLY